MNVLVIGGGGREHAIIQKLHSSPRIKRLFALPGNGGIAGCAENLAGSPLDGALAVRYCAEHQIGFAVVAPDDPLVKGVADDLRAAGIPVFGPSAQAAAIEGSKIFAKQLMKKYGIPTAAFEIFDDAAAALSYLKNAPFPAVIKADGLALGKGVIIANNYDEAAGAVQRMMVDKAFGESGSRILIEEFLSGPEVTVLAFTDSKTILPLASSMDHKRAVDGDKGPNTGGMGVIAPNPFYTADIAARCMKTIFLPTIQALAAEGRPFKGCLYLGLMLTPPRGGGDY